MCNVEKSKLPSMYKQSMRVFSIEKFTAIRNEKIRLVSRNLLTGERTRWCGQSSRIPGTERLSACRHLLLSCVIIQRPLGVSHCIITHTHKKWVLVSVVFNLNESEFRLLFHFVASRACSRLSTATSWLLLFFCQCFTPINKSKIRPISWLSVANGRYSLECRREGSYSWLPRLRKVFPSRRRDEKQPILDIHLYGKKEVRNVDGRKWIQPHGLW